MGYWSKTKLIRRSIAILQKRNQAAPTLKEAWRLLHLQHWPYTSQLREKLWLRDEALASIYILLAGRINEPLTSTRQHTPRKRVKIAEDTYRIEREETETWTVEGLRKSQFEVSSKGLILRDYNREKGSHGTNEFPLIQRGGFAPFTQSVLNWLDEVPALENFVFPQASRDGTHIYWNKTFGDTRARQIIDVLSGSNPYYPLKPKLLFPDKPRAKGKVWPHLLKSIAISAYIRAGASIENIHRLTGLTAANILLYAQPGGDLAPLLERAE